MVNTLSLTLTVQVADVPSSSEAVIVAVPTPTAVMVPRLTVATLSSLVDHSTSTFLSEVVAMSFVASPTHKVTSDLFREIEVLVIPQDASNVHTMSSITHNAIAPKERYFVFFMFFSFY
jgi:hypothetical protein